MPKEQGPGGAPGSADHEGAPDELNGVDAATDEEMAAALENDAIPSEDEPALRTVTRPHVFPEDVLADARAVED